MKNISLILAIIAILGIALCSGCGTSKPQGYAELEGLNKLVAERWSGYSAGKANFGGGLAMYVISPKGNFYASTNMPGGTADTHFRGASTTKTYTAAAIMLLHQQGKLNINDLITANITGSTEPYVPNTADYNIPYKGQITIKMLLNHRAGVWDVTNMDFPTTESVPYAGKNYLDYMKALDPEHTFTADELVGTVATCQVSSFVPDTD
ncbi:MAG: serine hydrolase domain-containing protein, partial [Candidatus Margulisiibacteriota bacterium]